MKIQQGKFASLPDCFSKDLERAIRGMIQLDAEKRPSIEQILALPRIALRYREVKLNLRYATLKQQVISFFGRFIIL